MTFASLYISVWEAFGTLGVFVLSEILPLLGGNTPSEERTAGTLSFNHFSFQRENGHDITKGIRIFPFVYFINIL